MPDLRRRTQLEYTWRFGGGTNTRASEDEIADAEDNGGVNFALDLENSHWRPRLGFSQVGLAPNAGSINGYAQLHKSDGTLSTLIQADDDVYEWDFTSSGFTAKTTVNSGAKIRGPLHHNWTLEDKVLITDLNKLENVAEWDGTTYQDLTAGSLTNFKAKYCWVENERAWFANITENAVSLPHMIAASGRGDEELMTVTDRPTSALGTGDPFQLTSPDLRPINGMVFSFGTVAFSTREGSMYRLVGQDSTNFAVLPLFSNSNAVGDEGVVWVGNDVFYGRAGNVEALSAAQALGDVAVDDLTRQIYTDKTRFNVKDVTEWRLVYDRSRQLLYAFPKDDDRCWVMHKSLYDDIVLKVARRAQVAQRSPWAMWETQHSTTFLPSTVWEMFDANKRRQVYFGDSSGRIFQMQTSDQFSDAAANIKSERLSRDIQTPLGAEWDVEGHVIYRASTTAKTLRLRFEYGGITVTNQDIYIEIPALPLGPVYNASHYYSNNEYYGTAFVGRLTRQPYTAAGRASRAQIRATIEGDDDFSIAEIKLRFKTAPQP